jgi:hypothetical protein
MKEKLIRAFFLFFFQHRIKEYFLLNQWEREERSKRRRKIGRIMEN